MQLRLQKYSILYKQVIKYSDKPILTRFEEIFMVVIAVGTWQKDIENSLLKTSLA